MYSKISFYIKYDNIWKLCFFAGYLLHLLQLQWPIQKLCQKLRNITEYWILNIETVSTKQYSRLSRDLKMNTLGQWIKKCKDFSPARNYDCKISSCMQKAIYLAVCSVCSLPSSWGRMYASAKQKEARSHEPSPPPTSRLFSSKICTKQSDAGTKWMSSFPCMNEDKTKHHSKLSLLLPPLLAYFFARDTITKV